MTWLVVWQCARSSVPTIMPSDIRSASLSARWLYALKPGSWPKLLVPAVLGQALGASLTGRLDPLALALGLGFTVCDLAFIVWLNDWADRDVDRIKRDMFPDACSPKTIPDDILPARHLLLAGLAAGALALGFGVVAAVLLRVPALGIFAVLNLVVFLAYSLPPIRANYRGGGELLEMLGVGLLLPWWNSLAQCQQLWHSALSLLGGFTVLSLSSAIASGLSDEESDRAGGKRTWVSLLGNAVGRRSTECLAWLGLLIWLGAMAFLPATVPNWSVIAAAILGAYHLSAVHRCSDAAQSGELAQQGIYKLHVHRAIWYPALVLVGGIVWTLFADGTSA